MRCCQRDTDGTGNDQATEDLLISSTMDHEKQYLIEPGVGSTVTVFILSN